jgi:hypothetical protein
MFRLWKGKEESEHSVLCKQLALPDVEDQAVFIT